VSNRFASGRGEGLRGEYPAGRGVTGADPEGSGGREVPHGGGENLARVVRHPSYRVPDRPGG